LFYHSNFSNLPDALPFSLFHDQGGISNDRLARPTNATPGTKVRKRILSPRNGRQPLQEFASDTIADLFEREYIQIVVLLQTSGWQPLIFARSGDVICFRAAGGVRQNRHSFNVPASEPRMSTPLGSTIKATLVRVAFSYLTETR
jgi:hypothetical protein